MIQRIITALLIIAVVVPPLWFGGWLLAALVALIIVVGGFELFQLTPNYRRMPAVFYFIILAVCFGLLFIDVKYRFVVLGMSIIIIMALPVFFARITSRDSFIISAVFVLFYTFASSFMAIHEYNMLLVWYVIIATYACDTGAYFTGYFFGKHKLCERISPKKTIEGSIGGIVFSIVLSTIFSIFLLKDMPLGLLISSAIGMPIVSQIGDLAFSAIKRNYNIKDFSNIFPGHGGFMDRIDSLVYNLVFFYALMMIFV